MSRREFNKFPKPEFGIEKTPTDETYLNYILFSDDAESYLQRGKQETFTDTVCIPDGVTVVKRAVHPRLTAIAIPHTVHTIGNLAFSVMAGHQTYEGYYDPREDDPIGNGYNTRLRTVILSEGLRVIGYSAFLRMTAITGLKLPKGLERIEEDAFRGCDGLTEIIFPVSVKTLGDGAFYLCNGIKKVIFNDGIEELPDNLFRCNGALSELTLPKTLKKLGAFCFAQCPSLENIDLPDSVEKIGGYAFSKCTAIKEFTFKRDIDCGENVFYQCENLAEFNIGSGVKHPESLPEAPCLKSVSVAKEHPDFVTVDGAVYTKDKKTLVRVPFGVIGGFTVPRGVTAIGDRAFAECKGITAVDLPSTLESIGTEAFFGCEKLEAFTIGGKVKTVGNRALAECKGLRALHVSQSVTRLGRNLLAGCENVEITVSPGNPIYKLENGVIVRK